MKQFTVLILIGILSSVALFIFPGMHASAHSSDYCLAILTNGAEAPCPEQNVFGFIKFHVDAFQTLSLAQILSLVLASFALLFVAALRADVQLLPVLAWRKQPDFDFSRVRQELISWFSLHENSPAFS